MKKITAVQRYFIRQAGPNDCGLACLGMILNYAGRCRDADRLFSETPVTGKGLSLLDLRKLAAGQGIDSLCVRMDLETLRANTKPCILHFLTANNATHFSVCFGSVVRKGRVEYLIGDPATGIHYLPEDDLVILWPTNAALYFDHLVEHQPALRDHPLFSLLQIRSFRKTLLIVIPFLNICSTLTGIALSWLLQRGINDSLADKRTSLVIAVVLLLFVITIFKGVISHVKQHVLIALNSAVSNQLTTDFLSRISTRPGRSDGAEKYIRTGLDDIRKIQHSVSAFVAVLFSEGALVTFIMAGIWYFDPEAALSDTVYVLAMGLLAYRAGPAMTLRSARLQELSGAVENALVDELKGSRAVREGFDLHLANHRKYLAYARSLAVRISRQILLSECLGTVNVIFIFMICLLQMQQQHLSYENLMVIVILSYFITALMPKIGNAFTVIDEGAALIRRYRP
jgi:ABC-type bacteriocin/lantibiotic exporter with double-glycine peptidase domain